MVWRIAVAAVGFALLAGPAAAEFVPFSMIQNDIQRALGRVQPKVVKPKAKKPSGDAAGKPAAPADKNARTEAEPQPATAAEDPVPIPRLRPAAAPETVAVGGFATVPQFSEADEGPGVGGFTSDAAESATAPSAVAGDPEGPALAYAAPQAPPIPRVNPRAMAAIAAIPPGDKPLKGRKPVQLAALPPGDAIDDAAGKTGMARLNALGVSAETLEPIHESACGMPDSVLISSLDGGDVPLSGVAKVNQAVATTFALWVRETVDPAAKSILGGELTGLRIADSYSCRTRDHIKNAKLSEHAYGNAIDVSAFRIGKQWIAVGGGHDADEQAFIQKVRLAACGPFKTVLGPGSDPFHADHLHLDLAKRRTSGPSRGLYCK